MKSRIRENLDFTRGNIYKSLVLFAIPIMLGELLQNLYQSTDSVILGNFVGEHALAAVSVCTTLTNLLVGFCNGISVGSTVVVSKAFGSGDRKRLADCVNYTYSFSILIGIGLSIIGLILSPLLVRISNVNEEISPFALTYLRIYICGLLFSIVYNNSAGILRGMGDMRTPFGILIISCSLNIIMDIVFCTVLDMGIAGVALATVIAQLISVGCSYYVLHKKMGFKCIAIRQTLESGMPIIREAMDVGVAAGIQGSIISFSNLFVWRYINRFSTAAVAGIGIGQRIDKFVSLPTNAYGTAVTTFAGQNLGAGNRARIREGIKDSLILSLATTVVLGIIMYPSASFIARLFNRNQEVIDTAVLMNHIMMPLYFLIAVRHIMIGVLRAHKRNRLSTFLTLAGMVGVRQIYLAVVMNIKSDIVYVIWGYPVGWFFAFLFVAIYYFGCRKKMFKEKTADLQ